MRRTISILFFAGTVLFAGFAQEATQEKSRNQKESATGNTEENISMSILDTQQYVITAERMSYRGYPAFGLISSKTNFLKVDGDKAVIQIEPQFNKFDRFGGLFTYEADISNYKRQISKKGDLTIKFTTFNSRGGAHVSISIRKGNPTCYVVIEPVFDGPTLSLSGSIIPLQGADLLEGIPNRGLN